jgi:c-type cytochrome biogenesis protein CcmF
LPLPMSLLGDSFLAAVILLYGLVASFALVSLALHPRKAARVLVLLRKVAFAAGGFSLVVFVLIAVAFLTDDFSLSVVGQYSAKDLPVFYKFSALWAGSSGSLLFWAVLVSLFFAFRLARTRTDDATFDALKLAFGSAASLGFFALLMFVAKPFAPATFTLDNGMGLKPPLMNFWMIIHPPLLFVGYAAFLGPFAIIPASVFAGRTGDPQINRSLRGWLLLGLCFLTAGIATGAKWSYVELGWGGYWAWDPVENASLLPWLLAMAALHALVGMRFSRGFRFWTILLTPAPFVLCLFAAFITRSNMLQSVHTFDSDPMPWALLVFISICLLLYLTCAIFAAVKVGVALPRLGTPILDMTGLLFWANVIFVATALIIALATFSPVLGRIFTRSGPGPVATRNFYDLVVSGAGPICAFLIGLSILTSLHSARHFLVYSLACAAAGLIAYGFVLSLSEPTILTALACGVCAFSLMGVLIKTVLFLIKGGRIGGTIAHLGLLILVVAAAFSATELVAQTRLRETGSFHLKGYEFIYHSFQHWPSENPTKVGPAVVVKKAGFRKTLWPHRVLYPDGEVAYEVAVHTGLREDVYVSYDGLEPDGRAIITVKIKPFMLWLWFAFVVMVVGLALATFENRRPKRVARAGTLQTST